MATIIGYIQRVGRRPAALEDGLAVDGRQRVLPLGGPTPKAA